MGELADRIWDRALDAMWVWATEGRPGPGPDVQWPGDVALHAVLLAHGVIMNGGVLHAVESLAPSQLVAAQHGYVWLGLTGVSDLLVEVAAQLGSTDDESLEIRSDAVYAKLLPDDEASIETALRARVSSSPSAFAPVRD